MLKKLVSVIIIIVIIASLLTACSQGETAAEEEAAAGEYMSEAEWYAANENNYVEQAEGITTAVIKEWYEDYTVYASYPVMTGKDEASQKMGSFVMDEISLYESEMAANAGAKYDVKPEFLLTYKPYIYADSLVSFKFVTYTDSGVSKTVNYIDTFVFDRTTGTSVALTDLFKEDTDFISAIAENAKAELLKNQMLNDHYDETKFVSGTAATVGNYSTFAVTENGILFFFNQGQIASPMAGSFEALVSFESLKDVLKDSVIAGTSILGASTETQSETTVNTELPSYLQSGSNELAAFSLDGIDPINDKVIAFTFDDGPHPSRTMQIVNVFKKYNAKATFFMLGQNAEAYPDIVQQVYDAGMEIANHSYNHPDFFKMSYDEMVANLEKSNDKIEEAIGKRPILFRAPYGNVSAEAAQQYGRQSVYWTIDTLDWDNLDVTMNYENTVNYAYDGAVVLMHDIHQPTADSVDMILSTLSERGYKFVTISQLDQILIARGQDPTWRLGRDASTSRPKEEE